MAQLRAGGQASRRADFRRTTSGQRRQRTFPPACRLLRIDIWHAPRRSSRSSASIPPGCCRPKSSTGSGTRDRRTISRKVPKPLNSASGGRSVGHANGSKCVDTGFGAMIGGASPDFVHGSASASRGRSSRRTLGPAYARRRSRDRYDQSGSSHIGHPRDAAPLGGGNV